MSHRPAAAAGAVAALLIAAVPAQAGAAAPKAKLAPASQSALVAKRAVHATVSAPAKSVATVALYADGHRVSHTRTLTFHRARRAKLSLALTSGGVKRLGRCAAHKLELRVIVKRGAKTTTVRDRVALKVKHCASSSARPANKPAVTPPADPPAGKPEDTPRSDDNGAGDDTPANLGPLFRVGTSVVDITPTKPMVLGGYSANYTVPNGAHDPLQVRAFFVGHGDKAVTFVSLDSQGWFASYQTPNVGDGAADARADAAQILNDRGYKVSAANVVVSATHDHAAPTIQGIWGHTDPAYLHQVKLAAVQAVSQAEQNAQDAELWSAQGTIRGLLSEVQGTDQMAGFGVDTSLPILWAREPGTGKTIGTYADVPVHVDQYDPSSNSDHQWSADYPGYVRNRLNQLLGGTSVIAAGTLGRQEGIGSSPEYTEVTKQGRFITNAITRALGHAQRITDTTLDAATQSFSTPATNMGLLMAMSCNHPGGPVGCQGGSEPASNGGTGTWFWSPGSMFTVNRSMASPWFTAGGTNTIGTMSTVARIGDQVYATAPGEGFPEVTSAIQRAFGSSAGIDGVHVIDHAGDQLGYYWDQRAGVYPSNQLAQSDFVKFNVGSQLAQDNVNAAIAAGTSLGLAPSAQDAYAQKDDPNAFSKPHVQAYADQSETQDTTVSLYSSAKKAQSNSLGSTTFGSSATSQDSQVSFDFGDGTPTETHAPSTRFDHTFPGPGTYDVTASIVDNLGAKYSWVQTVVIDTPLSAAVDRDTKKGKHILTVRPVGGSGDVISAHWTFSDGSSTDGTSVKHAPEGQATVAIVDGAGNTATQTVTVG